MTPSITEEGYGINKAGRIARENCGVVRAEIYLSIYPFIYQLKLYHYDNFESGLKDEIYHAGCRHKGAVLMDVVFPRRR